MSDTPEWDEWMLEQGAASPSGPSPAACVPNDKRTHRTRDGHHDVSRCHCGPSPAAGLDPDLAEQAFKNLGLWGDYPEWTKTRREYAEKFAAEYDRLSRSGGAGDGGDRP